MRLVKLNPISLADLFMNSLEKRYSWGLTNFGTGGMRRIRRKSLNSSSLVRVDNLSSKWDRGNLWYGIAWEPIEKDRERERGFGKKKKKTLSFNLQWLQSPKNWHKGRGASAQASKLSYASTEPDNEKTIQRSKFLALISMYEHTWYIGMLSGSPLILGIGVGEVVANLVTTSPLFLVKHPPERGKQA